MKLMILHKPAIFPPQAGTWQGRANLIFFPRNPEWESWEPESEDMKYLNYQIRQCVSQRYHSKSKLKTWGREVGAEVLNEQRKVIWRGDLPTKQSKWPVYSRRNGGGDMYYIPHAFDLLVFHFLSILGCLMPIKLPTVSFQQRPPWLEQVWMSFYFLQAKHLTIILGATADIKIPSSLSPQRSYIVRSC